MKSAERLEEEVTWFLCNGVLYGPADPPFIVSDPVERTYLDVDAVREYFGKFPSHQVTAGEEVPQRGILTMGWDLAPPLILNFERRVNCSVHCTCF